MPGQLSETQPALPIFGEETVWYDVPRAADQDQADYDVRRTRTLSVDEIDSLADTKLRQALWRQFGARTAPKSRLHNEVVVVAANLDDTLRHIITAPRYGVVAEDLERQSPAANNEETGVLPETPQASVRHRFMRRILR